MNSISEMNQQKHFLEIWDCYDSDARRKVIFSIDTLFTSVMFLATNLMDDTKSSIQDKLGFEDQDD